ncbi:hypothetical protein PTTG_25767 [Puccinia triticina 1-1 BBBD Race 1]|uniref:Uncharacterized protein n=1 Tax=Puccinia triticina (isolate 1-1 / race 1 (BBBD)) TaxID=630390 RepID=A0A180H0B3_PUCT1|nr:hypothetical protein PTTG_25767 [Puccinia triticina 1-1 BBBD Race 1]
MRTTRPQINQLLGTGADWSARVVHTGHREHIPLDGRTATRPKGFLTPLNNPEFIVEDVRVHTLAELAAQQDVRLGCHRRAVEAMHTSPSSPPANQSPLSVPLAAAASRAPRPNPWDLQRQKSARAAVSRVFTPVQVPSNPAGAARTFTPVVPAHESWSPAQLPASHGSDHPTSAPITHSWAPIPEASDIEVVLGPTSAPNSGIHGSPACKIARSPAGEGIAHTISRLNFGRPRSPPLALTIEEFLDLCSFERAHPVPRALINHFQICRWDYFLDATIADLRSLNFPLPIASQLLKGARWLVPSHADYLSTQLIKPEIDQSNTSSAQAGPSGSRATKTGSPGTHQPTTTLALAPPAPAPKDKPPVDQEGQPDCPSAPANAEGSDS